ncbi:uncharacterized protein LOC132621241 [Lycium barbarum]|uniref:uncharacterized protein LOC132621241 n=1 Tax=Lycium barbarum TaxID=112863 RepID=UPI00293F6D64|nr:uncharacterized protein LOC132621241 [Lycium barbarum]XP_060191409.1 uncharacterized protein LOC132621241 [Lycium barbarum]
MRSLKKCCGEDVAYHLLITAIAVVLLQAIGVVSVVAPNTGCYALDNSSHIHDFSSWIGQPFEYEGKGKEDPDLVVRFCKDVESRSRNGYVDYGRFDKLNYFRVGSEHVSFVQEYFNGDLRNCELSYDKMGRTAKVNIICGNCPHGQCKGGLGCICNVEYESTCRAVVELAIPCEKPGLRIFEGFTVGFHPRSWEIVYNGMTQMGYEAAHKEFSFITAQTHVALYMTAIASVSGSVQKPLVKVSPEQGLKVRLSGSAATGGSPTTLSPTVLLIDWICDIARDNPYEVQVTVPIKDYDPIQFTLTKMCENQQSEGGDAARGWAIFGVLSCIVLVASTLFCCGGFIYKTRVQNQRGLDALPGMTLLSACLETVSGVGHGYSRPEDVNNPFANQASWERQPTSTQATGRTSEVRYGSI